MYRRFLLHYYVCGLWSLLMALSPHPCARFAYLLYTASSRKPTKPPFQKHPPVSRTKNPILSEQVECTTCRRNFCFKHRHEEDHKCEGTAEASRREHPHLRKRGVGGAGVPKDKAATANLASKPAAGATGERRPCGTEAGEAAARREREARAGRGAGVGIGVAAR